MPSEQVSRLSWKWKKPFSAKIVGRERMRKQRKQCTAEEQVVILIRHFLEGIQDRFVSWIPLLALRARSCRVLSCIEGRDSAERGFLRPGKFDR
jgi:hypothetical protein